MQHGLGQRKRSAFVWLAALCIIVFSAGMWIVLSRMTDAAFAGKSGYYTYTLQAMAWRAGKVSLGQDYPWLELAVYKNDWYVSFPPVPTVPIYLLTFVFGDQVPDNLLVKIYALIGMLAVYFALKPERRNSLGAAFVALMSGFCGSVMALSTQGAVWYQAQILAFCLTMLAVSLTVRGRITPALLCYALAVGCRPFNVAYGPLLMFIWWRRQENRSLAATTRGLWKGVALGLLVAALYALYNLIRFGNPLEFGTNYLPEFMRSAYGQFSLRHVPNNLKSVVLGWPFERTDTGWALKRFGFSLFLANPLLICLTARFVIDICRRKVNGAKALCMALFLTHMFLLLLHRTFGGFQFGARYAVDLVPYYLAYLCVGSRRVYKWEIALMLAGLAFSLYGVAMIHL